MHAEHARVAVHLDRQAKPARLKPERAFHGMSATAIAAPKSRYGSPRGAVLLFVAQHERAQRLVERENPLRQHDVHRPEADDRRSNVVRELNANAIHASALPRGARPLERNDADRQPPEQQQRERDPQPDERPVDDRARCIAATSSAETAPGA